MMMMYLSLSHHWAASVIFESGHIVAAKPIYPETLFSSEIPIKNFTKLHRYERRTVFRAEWLYQGWSEIAGYHVGRAGHCCCCCYNPIL